MFATDSPFAEEFQAFALAEKTDAVRRDAVLFYGSSSIRLWETLERDFEGTAVVNRGFGGSTLADCVQHMSWLVYSCQPRAILLYAGDNDLESGAAPERILELFQEFERGVRSHLGGIPLAFVSVKPSPSRAWNLARIREANRMVRDYIEGRPALRFLDVFSTMLDAAERPRRDLFTDDCLHMNAAGYRVWTAVVRDWLCEIDASS